MGGPGSGKRTLGETTAVLPELGDSENAVGRFVDAVAMAVALDQVDPRVADTLKDLARTKLAALRQNSERKRIDELKEIIDRAERLYAEGQRHVQRVRQNREQTLTGVWQVDDWTAALESVGRRPRIRLVGGDDAED